MMYAAKRVPNGYGNGYRELHCRPLPVSVRASLGEDLRAVVDPIAGFAVKAVGIEERKEELGIFFFAVVWGGGNQQKMPGN